MHSAEAGDISVQFRSLALPYSQGRKLLVMNKENWRLPPQEQQQPPMSTQPEPRHRTASTSGLSDLRMAIDDLDQQIAELLNKRLLLAQQIGTLKATSGRPVKDQNRENQVIENVTSATDDPVITKALTSIYRTVLQESCLVQQQPAGRDDAASPAISGLNAGSHALNLQTEQTRHVEARTIYFPRILIVGVGLIGGAIARQIKNTLPETTIVGLDSRNVLEQALREGFIDKAANDLPSAVKNASLILLCAPPHQNVSLLEEIAPLAKRRQVIIDVSSTKSTICAAAEKLPLKADFIGGHPLFGSHQQGLAAAHGVNTKGKTFCLIPTQRSSEITLRRATRWLSELGFHVECTSARNHDATLAATSHLVQLLSTALGSMLMNDAALDISESNPEARAALSGTAIRSLSRLMLSPSSLWLEILEENKLPVCVALTRFENELKLMRKLIKDNDRTALETHFTDAATFATLLERQE